MKSGPCKSECYDDYTGLTFTISEHLRNQWNLTLDFLQGQEDTNNRILTSVCQNRVIFCLQFIQYGSCNETATYL